MAIAYKPIEACKDTQPFAECLGVDLADELTPATVEELRLGLMEHGLLLFRNQMGLRPENEVRFNEAFGWHDSSQNEFMFGFGAPTTEHRVSGGAQLPLWPQVSILGNVKIDQYHGVENLQLVPKLGFTYSGWHADGLHDLFDGMPEMTTMYNPSGFKTTGGGATYFTSGVRAMERMDPDIAEELEKCVVAYMRCPNDDMPDESRRVTPGPSFMVDEGTRRIGFAIDMENPDAGLHDFQLEFGHADQGGRHRAVRIHPETGQKSFYATPGRAVYLLDTETGEMRHDRSSTEDILSMALLPSVKPGIRYEHFWQEGDFVAWLNTLVLHSASDPVGIEGDRLLHRVRLSTPKTRWKDGEYLYF